MEGQILLDYSTSSKWDSRGYSLNLGQLHSTPRNGSWRLQRTQPAAAATVPVRDSSSLLSSQNRLQTSERSGSSTFPRLYHLLLHPSFSRVQKKVDKRTVADVGITSYFHLFLAATWLFSTSVSFKTASAPSHLSWITLTVQVNGKSRSCQRSCRVCILPLQTVFSALVLTASTSSPGLLGSHCFILGSLKQ